MRKDDETEKNNPLRMTNEPLADVTTSYTLNADGTVTKAENKILKKTNTWSISVRSTPQPTVCYISA